ncbi:MAG TPA: POTRA domain-containing protein [Ignavibacteriaceae bacterium]|nr:POTRA domain-containing protein [Ignavibacteriaceae bacterium]
MPKGLLLLFLLIAAINIKAQNDTLHQKFVIDSIFISGNKITDEDIILRELTFNIGDSVDNDLLIYNKERIYSLGIFNRVELKMLDSVKEINLLNIQIEESWYIYPLPFVDIKENDWKKISYGINLLIKNFRGRNETVQTNFSLGYDPSLSLGYYIPAIAGFEKYFIYFALGYASNNVKSIFIRKKFGEFEQKFSSFNIGFGKQFNVYNSASVSLGYQYVESPFYFPGLNADNERIDRFPVIGLKYEYDTRDLSQFPTSGLFTGAELLIKGLDVNNINYEVFNLEFREYRKIIDKLIGKWRFYYRTAFGEFIPYYDYSYLGYSEVIRGHSGDYKEGHNLYMGSLEFYYPIFRDYFLNFDFIPIVPEELLRYRVGLYVQAFGETGTTINRRDKLRIKALDTGFGFGFTLLFLPYNLLRVEYAFDEKFNREWVVDLGISF